VRKHFIRRNVVRKFKRRDSENPRTREKNLIPKHVVGCRLFVVREKNRPWSNVNTSSSAYQRQASSIESSKHVNRCPLTVNRQVRRKRPTLALRLASSIDGSTNQKALYVLVTHNLPRTTYNGFKEGCRRLGV
jgi:hypothetical protein